MKVALAILTTLVSMAMLKWPIASGNPFAPRPGLGSLVYNERSNIFVGKIMPSKYVETTEPVAKPCQCQYLCLALNCTSATWLGMPNNSDSFCLISHKHFHLFLLQDPSAEDYSTYFQIEGHTPIASYCMTFYWFRDDYKWHGKFYKLHTTSSLVSPAQKTCISEGGRLATLETEEEFQNVTKILLHAEGAMYWVGLYSFNTTEPPMWQYINGAAEASKDHIQNHGSSRCFSIQYYSHLGWFFKDSNCGDRYYFVCERNF